MGLINYKDIDFNKSINKENKTINFNGSEIQIINYLSANDKYDLIMVTLQKSFERGIYNPFKIDMYFNLHIIYMYTNIVFNADGRADEVELYDTLKKSGLLDAVLAEIDENEIQTLKEYIYKTEKSLRKYNSTFGATISNFIEQLPAKIEELKNTIENFDPELLNKLKDINLNNLN